MGDGRAVGSEPQEWRLDLQKEPDVPEHCRQRDLKPEKPLCVSMRVGVSLLSERSKVSFPNGNLKEPLEEKRSWWLTDSLLIFHPRCFPSF